tara:strand:- start:8 stop:178 length:171 start_codon:yes stop_codon:yes gene_type:complete
MARENNRIQNSSKFIKQPIQRMVKTVDKEIQRIEKRIRQLIQNDRNSPMKSISLIQ